MNPHDHMSRNYWEADRPLEERISPVLAGTLLGVGYAILVLALACFAIFENW